mmetsp:Transcript_7435/g.8416  ORF Transcript_7435/g.8416 Transcript_7435/m.8416 type:complete len:146 (-) Transcript_7435:13-450(-)
MPILYGDNKNVILGPHNVGYSSLNDHLKEAKIQVHTNYVKNFTKPILANGDKMTYSILEESEFFKLAMPKSFKDFILLVTPQNYIDALMARLEMFNKIQEKISGAKLNSDEEKMLHVAIQGYFREWLVSNSHHKKINELVRLIDQ